MSNDDGELNLGDEQLEKWVVSLQAGGSKLSALSDEVISVAKILQKKMESIDGLETSLGELENESIIIADEQADTEVQLAEMMPAKERIRISKKNKRKRIEEMEEEFVADSKNKSMHSQAIDVLEVQIGQGAGWTNLQLAQKREVQRDKDEALDYKKRKQQELDQILRENDAGRKAVDRATFRLQSLLKTLEEDRTSIAKYEKLARNEIELKRQRQDDIKNLHEHLSFLRGEVRISQRALIFAP